MVVVFVVIEETRTFARGGGKVRRTVVFVWYFVLLLCVNVCVCISEFVSIQTERVYSVFFFCFSVLCDA